MADTPMVVEVDCVTGAITERPMNDDELAAQAQAQAEFEAQEAQRIADEEAKAQALASAQAKLASLGLTADEIKALTA